MMSCRASCHGCWQSSSFRNYWLSSEDMIIVSCKHWFLMVKVLHVHVYYYRH